MIVTVMIVTQVQYERFSEFTEFGILTHHFRIKSAVTFSAIIDVLTKETIEFAMFEEQDI